MPINGRVLFLEFFRKSIGRLANYFKISDDGIYCPGVFQKIIISQPFSVL